MEWTPEVWAVLLASDFGFSSDVLTLPSLQPKLPIPREKLCAQKLRGMANGEAVAFQAHPLQEACSIPVGGILLGVRAPRDVGVDWRAVSVRTGATQPCSVTRIVPGPQKGLHKQSLSERIHSFLRRQYFPFK